MAAMKGFDEFMELVKSNPAVKAELKDIDTHTDDEYCARFVEIGAKHGYAFPADDVEELIEEYVADSIKNGELTDAQLEAVAGGGKVGDLVDGITDIIEWLEDDDD